jgi:hypothetical protein
MGMDRRKDGKPGEREADENPGKSDWMIQRR